MLKLVRRTAALLGCAAMLSAAPAIAQDAAANYPDKPIRLIVPYPAGGATDILARMMAQKFQEEWKQPMIVENRSGAGGTIGANQVARAEPDGYTVLFSITAMVQQISLMKLPYDPLKDFIPLTQVAVSTSVLAVPQSVPANTLPELIEYVKSEPGNHTYGTYGAGTSSHLQGALLNLQAGTELTHVPYQGAAPLVTAMMGDQLTATFFDAGSSRQHLPKFKLLAVTGPERLSWLPDVPTLKELGMHSFEPRGWFALFMPKGTPEAIADKFTAQAQEILKMPDVREKIESMGLIPGGMPRAEFGPFLEAEAKVYADIIRDTNITLN